MKERYKSFLACWEHVILDWFIGSRFNFWLELKTNLLQTWFVVMTSTDAIVEVAKYYQKMHKHICVYTLNVIEYWRFS